MVVFDDAFKGVGQKKGIEIWRINKFKVEPIPREEYGSFYEGDSYIVLNTKGDDKWDVHFWLGKSTTQTYEIEDDNDNPKLFWDVHFWLGATTSHDEMGSAAIKTVELDDSLGGFPVQYREVQGHESGKFQAMFKNGLKYLHGGYETGFRKVEDLMAVLDKNPRLFQCKGKRRVRCTQVKLDKKSLNKGDVFILDCGKHIYVWTPPGAGKMEKVKGIQIACNIRDSERAGRGKVEVLDKHWASSEGFWSHLGGYVASEIASADAGGDDDQFWVRRKHDVQLWKVSDSSGRIEVRSVAVGDQVTSDKLDTNDAFILDNGVGNIFVWVGKGCSMDERKKSMAYAQEYIASNKRPPWTQVVRVLESAEPSRFIQWFAKWDRPHPTGKLGNSDSDRKLTLAKNRHLFHCSDASGALIIEEIVNFTQADLNEEDTMILDIGPVVYFWIGGGASDKEKTAGKKIAESYMKLSPLPRPKSAKLEVIQQGQAPQEFKNQFENWSDDFFEEQRLEKVMAKLDVK